MVEQKYVYFFGNGKAEGKGTWKELLGGKGAGLAEMTNLEIPVPAGFTITTELCAYYDNHGKTYPPELEEQVRYYLGEVEKTMEAQFGSNQNPLLVSIRSGTRQ